MFNIVALMTLLWLVGENKAKRYGCGYTLEMEPDKSYYIHTANYPRYYKPGVSCRWVARSDRPITITCDEFKLPFSNACNKDAVTVEDGTSPGRRYCGKRTFSVTSRSKEMTITLTSPTKSPSGRFICKLRTIKTNHKNNCLCGLKNPTRIVGGVQTGVNEFPMMAGLVHAKHQMIFCGATIINERQVLTAAHCIGKKKKSNYGVVVGEHDISRGKETDATKIIHVESVLVNSLYDWRTLDNDIALITLTERIKFTHKVRPVCLPFQHSVNTFAKDNVQVLGWGSKEFGGRPSKTVQKVSLSVITNDKCRKTYSSLTKRQLCTYRKNKDSCQFDSGGPVLWQHPTTGRLVNIGVISLGKACAEGDPAVNTRVGAFIDWIVTNTLPGIGYCELQ